MGLSGPRRSAAHDAPWRCVRAVAHRCVCIGRKCGAIGQVVWLSMCKRGRCFCSDLSKMAHALGSHTGQARTP
eukprot:5750885-Pleurochrysis_carterae.AAC.1